MEASLVVDVAVIGGGLAGLTAATAAADAGARVALVDARSVGGRARSARRDGYVLNEGAHALYRAAGGWAALERLGVHPRGATPPAESYRVVWDGEIARLPADARSILTSRLLGVRSKRKLAAWFGDVARTASSAGTVSLDQWLEDEGARPDLRKYVHAMARLVTYAARPGRLPAGVVLGQFAAGGVAYLHGGWQQIVDALASLARREGVQVFEHEPVTELVGLDGRWAVVTGERTLIADAIVVAAGGPRLAVSLLGEDPAAWVERAGPVQRAASLDVGGERGRADFLLSADEPLYSSLHAPIADLAPDGAHLSTLMRYLAPDDPFTATENRATLERHAATAGLPARDARVIDRFLAAATVAWGTPQVGVDRPTGLELAGRGVFAAGDWVGRPLLADATIVSGANAGAVAARRAMVSS